MNKLGLACLLVILVCSLAIYLGASTPPVAAAEEERIELDTKYPIRGGPSDSSFDFLVTLRYTGGQEPRIFEVSAEGPPGWQVSVWQSASGVDVPSIKIDPKSAYPDSVVVHAQPPYGVELGDYPITFRAASGHISAALNLTARVTARYEFSAEPENGRYNIRATAGQDSHLTLIIKNVGTAPLEVVHFRTTNPPAVGGQAWTATFDPSELGNFTAGQERQVLVTVKPPAKAVAGDYMMKIWFLSNPAVSDSPVLHIRITVETSSRWGWIGAGIVIAVIAGLFYVVRRFGRR